LQITAFSKLLYDEFMDDDFTFLSIDICIGTEKILISKLENKQIYKFANIFCLNINDIRLYNKFQGIAHLNEKILYIGQGN
jgi:hypothetical protein